MPVGVGIALLADPRERVDRLGLAVANLIEVARELLIGRHVVDHTEQAAAALIVHAMEERLEDRRTAPVLASSGERGLQRARLATLDPLDDARDTEPVRRVDDVAQQTAVYQVLCAVAQQRRELGVDVSEDVVLNHEHAHERGIIDASELDG